MNAPAAEAAAAPLAGVRVVEFSHTVMGPVCGMVLADLGADVIKVEPPEGDRTRRLTGFGTGYFGYFNRNKRSLSLDLKSPPGQEAVRRLVERADIMIENFAPGTMARQGLDYPTVSAFNPRIVYCALKGFLSGPYEHRAALDEVVQMMGGLAYMTGPLGRPLRAGTSVVDIVGGLFGAFASVLALQERAKTGRGRLVESALFESTVFLMGQHLAYAAHSTGPIPPMPERVSAWAIYEIFATADDQVFIGITSDRQWQRFCAEFGASDLAADARLVANNDRITARPWLIPRIKAIFAALPMAEALAKAERADISYAPIARPESLFTDPHLLANGTLQDVILPGGIATKLPQLPVRMDGQGFPLRRNPPGIGEHSRAILSDLGFSDDQCDALLRDIKGASGA